MKRSTLFNVGVTLSLIASNLVTLPALAKSPSINQLNTQQTTTEQPALTKSQKSQVQEKQIIPKSAAIVITFPNTVEIDVGQKQEYSAAMPLSMPILDNQGNVAIPAQTLVMVKLVPTGGDAKLIAESLIVNGQVIPIKASGSKISGQKIKIKRGPQKAGENSGTYSRLGSNVFEAFGGNNIDNLERGAIVGQGVGIVMDLMSPETVQVVAVPAGSSYVLTLDAPIVLQSN